MHLFSSSIGATAGWAGEVGYEGSTTDPILTRASTPACLHHSFLLASAERASPALMGAVLGLYQV